jgi:patatin-like phospholipase/acyl hydrolase
MYLLSLAGSRMLVLNSSGLSSILHIETLQQLERVAGRKVFEMFEWVVATGLSALFTLLMVYGMTHATTMTKALAVEIVLKLCHK